MTTSDTPESVRKVNGLKFQALTLRNYSKNDPTAYGVLIRAVADELERYADLLEAVNRPVSDDDVERMRQFILNSQPLVRLNKGTKLWQILESAGLSPDGLEQASVIDLGERAAIKSHMTGVRKGMGE